MSAGPDPVANLLLAQVDELGSGRLDDVAVLDDPGGQLVAGLALRAPGPVRCANDSLLDEVAVDRLLAERSLSVQRCARPDERLLAQATLVLLRLPGGLEALEEIAAAVSRWSDPDVLLLAGARVKHMNRGMNQVLQRHFGDVRASLGRQKSRALVAMSPRPSPPSAPRSRWHADLELSVLAVGSVFGGTAVDAGTRFLLEVMEVPTDAARVADLGCGTGVIATVLARRLEHAQVLATDERRSACDSAAATVAANGVADRVSVRRTDLLGGVEEGSLDLVVCNPPFHRGAARNSGDAFRMVDAAARALRPGGELWTVFNAHLPYLPALRSQVGPSTIAGRNRDFIVVRSRASGAAGRPAG